MVVVGVDGCRDGWIAVVWRDGALDVHFWKSIRQVSDVAGVQVMAIDIPVGLSVTGERRAEALARERLPKRASTVFNAPPRACLDAGDPQYARANALCRRDGGKGLSRQSFGLLAKIRDVDSFWASAPCPIFEVHPELSFARLNAGVPLAPKKSWAGVLARREMLLARGFDLDGFDGPASWRVAPDDVLDAAVCAWTARLILQGDVECLPDPPEFDATGREMSIRV